MGVKIRRNRPTRRYFRGPLVDCRPCGDQRHGLASVSAQLGAERATGKGVGGNQRKAEDRELRASDSRKAAAFHPGRDHHLWRARAAPPNSSMTPLIFIRRGARLTGDCAESSSSISPVSNLSIFGSFLSCNLLAFFVYNVVTFCVLDGTGQPM